MKVKICETGKRNSHLHAGGNVHRIFQMKSLLILLLLYAPLCFGQQTEAISHRYFNNFEDSILNAAWMNAHTIASSADGDQNHYSKTDAANPYSAGLEMSVPENLRNHNFKIVISGLIRKNPVSDIQLVVSVAKDDSAVFWKGFAMHDSANTDDWSGFQYSVLVPGSIPGSSKLKIFVWNADAKAEADVDNFEMVLTRERMPSFLPVE